MTKLESTEAINKLKLSAIKNGGYIKHSKAILNACAEHNKHFDNDLTPKQLIP